MEDGAFEYECQNGYKIASRPFNKELMANVILIQFLLGQMLRRVLFLEEFV